jgi:hypothetical protein
VTKTKTYEPLTRSLAPKTKRGRRKGLGIDDAVQPLIRTRKKGTKVQARVKIKDDDVAEVTDKKPRTRRGINEKAQGNR